MFSWFWAVQPIRSVNNSSSPGFLAHLNNLIEPFADLRKQNVG